MRTEVFYESYYLVLFLLKRNSTQSTLFSPLSTCLLVRLNETVSTIEPKACSNEDLSLYHKLSSVPLRNDSTDLSFYKSVSDSLPPPHVQT